MAHFIDIAGIDKQQNELPLVRIDAESIGISVRLGEITRSLCASEEKLSQLQNIIASFIEDNGLCYSEVMKVEFIEE